MNTNTTRKGYSKMVVDHVRSEFKIYIGIGVSLVALYGWMQTEFVTVAKARENMVLAQATDTEQTAQIINLAKGIEASNTLILFHMEKVKLDDILGDIRRNEQEVFNIEQFVSVNGENEQATARLRALNTEHEDLLLQRSCIINKNDLCN